jgi:hypothetical protein
MVVDGDEVDEEGGAADEAREEEGREEHLPDPDLGRFINQQSINISTGWNSINS